MENHYCDNDGFYAHSKPATPGTKPPINAVRCELPVFGENEWLKINKAGTGFEIIPNFEGVVYYLQDGTRKTCLQKGELLPVGVLQDAPPTKFYTSHNGVNWLLDIDRFKTHLCDQGQATMSEAKRSGFYIDTVLFDSDNNARTAYLMLAIAISGNPAYQVESWKPSTGHRVLMDAPLFAQVRAKLEELDKNCHAWLDAKEEEISACATPEALEAVSLVYGE